ncbi:hypothetical protein DM01DRAFT_19985 [Hesseltinella vesiculosa]|uniref:Uncharacterized protein n=1 Tax=Hesseltinella vesiculosa TaxID=101127 RepID=A0A1X2GVR8_9FUNG|nr:hypothetical protein DM01DRAFT_19985 [Hesseltinella vesiculosa]
MFPSIISFAWLNGVLCIGLGHSSPLMAFSFIVAIWRIRLEKKGEISSLGLASPKCFHRHSC